MQNIPLEEAYATLSVKPDPFTIRTKKLVDEFVVSDIHTDRSCEKETVLDNGRRAVMKGTYCASTFVGKLYKMNGPSENPLERYVLFVGVARQNPIDNRQDEDLAVEMAAENAMVNPIMTIKLPTAISGDDFVRFVIPVCMPICITSLDFSYKSEYSPFLTENEKFINNSSSKEDLVLDPFTGSGTTAIACINTNRKFIGFEIDKGYYELGVNRLKNAFSELK